MLKKIRQNWEVIYPFLACIIAILILIFLKEKLFPVFVEKNVNGIIQTFSLALTGFILTAYTVFLGFYNQISQKVRNTVILDIIEKRFRFSIVISIILFIFSLVFIFYENIWFPPVLITLTLFIVLLLLLLIDYLKLLFKDIRKN